MKSSNKQYIDLYKSLADGTLPSSCMPGCVWDQHLFLDLLPLITSHPYYQKWSDSLDVIESIGFRCGPDVPVVETGINITRNESIAPSDKFINSFMQEMANALIGKSHPYEEIFAVILDAMYTFQLRHYNTLATLH